jgi:predicted amidohydrolase
MLSPRLAKPTCGAGSARQRRRATAVAAVVMAASVLLSADADARRVRVFAVGPKIDVERWFDTREHYRDKLFALVDRKLRGKRGVPPIQRGARDVASHLLGPSDAARPVQTARDLVALPEDVGLWTMLTGSRGVPARAVPPAPSASVTAVTSLLGTYAPLISHYTGRFPALTGRGLPARALVISMTDTFARVAVETFAELADRYDVYLVAGVNMARDWRVVCTDREAFNSASRPRLPGGVRCEEESPAKVALLRSPDEPGRGYAYEATTPEAVNMALIFDPRGRLISKQVKTYLTPSELPGAGLDLVPNEVSGLGLVRTPVGRLGVVTSKDAWMPDVISKLDQYRVDVLIQPEYFTGDLVRRQGPWSPDTLLASGYSDVLRQPSFETMVLPELTGNAFDVGADAQSHVATRVRGKRSRKGRALVGQPEQRGFEVVSRWVVRDPTTGTIAARRARLGAAGEKLGFDSGAECADPTVAAPCSNGQVEDVLFTDVKVKRSPHRHRYRGKRRKRRFSVNRPLHRSGRDQRNVALAADGRRVVAAFEQVRGARSRVVVARSANGGRGFADRLARPATGTRGASARPGTSPQEWSPSVAISDRRVWAAWTERRSGSQRVHVALSRDAGRRFRSPIEVPPASGAPGAHRQWLPALASDGSGGAHLAYVEEDGLSDDDALPQSRVVFRRIDPNGTLGPPQRLDQGRPVELASKLDNAWAPAIAAAGPRLTVAWVDFRTYDWRPYARTSTDGGASFGPERDVSSAFTTGPQPLEQLADSPSVALDVQRSYVAWTDWRKDENTNVRPSRGYDTWLASTEGGGFTPEIRADQRGAQPASTFWPALAAEGGDALVAFQDSGTGRGDIRIARLRRGTDRGPALRADDTHPGINQYRPAIAIAGRRVILAWEDERNGPMQIYVTRVLADRVP